MANWDDSVSDTTVPGLGRCAANARERITALRHAVLNVWTTEDIGLIQRVDSQCLWVMWRRNNLPPS